MARAPSTATPVKPGATVAGGEGVVGRPPGRDCPSAGMVPREPSKKSIQVPDTGSGPAPWMVYDSSRSPITARWRAPSEKRYCSGGREQPASVVPAGRVSVIPVTERSEMTRVTTVVLFSVITVRVMSAPLAWAVTRMRRTRAVAGIPVRICIFEFRSTYHKNCLIY